jgi:hypothetical protein
LSTVEQPVTFENTNLAKVDPNSAPALPVGDYTFQIVDAELRGYEKDGVAKQRLSLGLAVVKSGDGKSIGRRMYETLFPGETTEKMLKLICNATGIQQSGSFTEWLDALKAQRPTFDAPIVERKRSDTGAMENRVAFFQVTPASV